MKPSVSAPSPPWWKFGHVWLVIAGPAVVIVAGFATLALALRFPDPVIPTDANRQGQARSQPRDNPLASMAPAVQGRNHAQTGIPAGRAAPASKP